MGMLRLMYKELLANQGISTVFNPDVVILQRNRNFRQRSRVMQLFHNGCLATAEDFYHAAAIFYHGSSRRDFFQAWLFAEMAADRRYCPVGTEPHPKWLAAAAKDRYLIKSNMLQHFGTQSMPPGMTSKALHCTVRGLWPVDPTVSDELRKQWHVPPLERRSLART